MGVGVGSFIRKYLMSVNSKSYPMVTAILIRTRFETKQTLGDFYVYNSGNEIFNCKTLELPWNENKNKISCIPEASYQVVKRHSKKYNKHLHVTDVVGRDFILIHSGNYFTDTKGCILVGSGYTDINKDKVQDIINSKRTLQAMLELLPSSFKLTIQKQLIPVNETLIV